MSTFRRIAFVIAILGTASGAMLLGRWQLRRLAARRASNTVLLAARARPPLRLPADLERGLALDSGRRAIAHGHFDTSGQILLRERVQDESPGLQVVTPVMFDSSRTVLWVLRGFVRSPDAVTPPDTIPQPIAGDVDVSGLLLAVPVTKDSGRALTHNGTTTWSRLDRDMLRRRRTGSLDVYLLLDSSTAQMGRLPVAPPAELGNGPHLSYAIQWFGIALAILCFGVIVLWRDGRAPPPHDVVP